MSSNRSAAPAGVAPVIQANFPGGQVPGQLRTRSASHAGLAGTPFGSGLALQARTLQRASAPLAFRPGPGILDDNRLGQGAVLPDPIRQKMESFFGQDFSEVRVYQGAQAAALGALAFTVGTQIHFASGQYQPYTQRGQELLGHELAHVVQQRQGRVVNPYGSGLAVVHDAALEQEAEKQGQLAAKHQGGSRPVSRSQGRPPNGTHSGALLRAARPVARADSASASRPGSSAMRPGLHAASVQRAEEASTEKKAFRDNGAATLLLLAAECADTENIEGIQFDVIDLKLRNQDTQNKKLYRYLYEQLAGMEINHKNGPIYRNDNKALPAVKNGARYVECYYAGGGLRAVVDTELWITYVSAHYGTFYVLRDDGHNPISMQFARACSDVVKETLKYLAL